MNQPTRVMTGATKLACKLDMSVGYLRYRYREDGGYQMSVVPLAAHASECNPEDLMKQYYKLLEEDIREQPWNYLWSHKRWK
jgi:KDO2-lipid IV(A) lauroyltransferase